MEQIPYCDDFKPGSDVIQTPTQEEVDRIMSELRDAVMAQRWRPFPPRFINRASTRRWCSIRWRKANSWHCRYSACCCGRLAERLSLELGDGLDRLVDVGYDPIFGARPPSRHSTLDRKPWRGHTGGALYAWLRHSGRCAEGEGFRSTFDKKITHQVAANGHIRFGR